MSVKRVNGGDAGMTGGPAPGDGGMQPWHRWQDWVNLILGIWLFIAPWIWHSTTASAASATDSGWNAWVLGVIVVVMALWALAAPAVAAPEWINTLAGIWLFIAPWALGFSAVGHSSAWNQWVVGIIVLVLSLSTMSHRGGSGQHHGHHGMA